MDQARFRAVKDRTNEVLAMAQKLYGVDIKPEVSFNLRGRVAGWASCKWCARTSSKLYRLRFNCDLIQGDKHYQDILDETVPHEVAHLVCFARPELGRKHNDGWRRVCLALGGNGKTRHDYEVVPAGGGITYRATCGTLITVSRVIHAKIQRGQSRILRKTRGRLHRECAWAPHGQTVPENPPSAVAPPSADATVQRVMDAINAIVTGRKPGPAPAVARPVVGPMSKAGQVREKIREARGLGRGQNWVAEWARDNLGMTRGMAARYVEENWERA